MNRTGSCPFCLRGGEEIKQTESYPICVRVLGRDRIGFMFVSYLFLKQNGHEMVTYLFVADTNRTGFGPICVRLGQETDRIVSVFKTQWT